MKAVIIHGQGHKGVTYTMTSEVVKNLGLSQENIKEFFLPKDGPEFCVGCNTCFLKGEEHCPGAEKALPIMQAMEQADILILDSPNYVMEMSGSLKNLMDHFAYRWVTHRPCGAMFTKVGITVVSSAGAPCRHTTKSMAKQLKWMGVSKVYQFPFVCNALNVDTLSEKKRREIQQKAGKIAKKVRQFAESPRSSFRGRLFFSIFRKMQMSPDAAWNPRDRDWWVEQGWTGKVRPWSRRP